MSYVGIQLLTMMCWIADAIVIANLKFIFYVSTCDYENLDWSAAFLDCNLFSVTFR